MARGNNWVTVDAEAGIGIPVLNYGVLSTRMKKTEIHPDFDVEIAILGFFQKNFVYVGDYNG